MRPRSTTVGSLGSAVDNNICLSQTTAGVADLVLNGALVSGSVATMDTPRRVLITCGGNDTGITYTVYGTNKPGNAISETKAGVSGSTMYTSQDFATVTRIATSGATSGSGVKVGTNGIASSWPIFFDTYGLAQISLQVDVTGTVNYTIQQTLLDPSSVGWVNAAWESHPDATNLVGASASAQGNYAYLPFACRVLLNTGSTGSVKLTAIQAGTPRR